VELTHALRTAQLIVRSATLRRESRGGHWRTDLPERDPLWDGVHVELIGGRDG
jgi:L-aspartate oxidase